MAPRVLTPRRLVINAERRFQRARLVFGHGTDNARDEAVFLVFHALGLPFNVNEATLDRPVAAEAAASVEALVARRISEQRPAAYLTGRMWFCGHELPLMSACWCRVRPSANSSTSASQIGRAHV